MTDKDLSSPTFYLEVVTKGVTTPQLVPMSKDELADLIAASNYRVLMPQATPNGSSVSYTFHEVGLVKSSFELTTPQVAPQDGTPPLSPDSNQGSGVASDAHLSDEDAPGEDIIGEPMVFTPIGDNKPAEVKYEPLTPQDNQPISEKAGRGWFKRSS